MVGVPALLPFGLWNIVRRPTWQDAVTFGGYAAMFIPWFAIGRSQFIWYMLPAVPFMCLCVASTLRQLPARVAKGLGVAFAAVTAAAAIVFAPLWAGWWVPNGWIQGLSWLPNWRFRG